MGKIITSFATASTVAIMVLISTTALKAQEIWGINNYIFDKMYDYDDFKIEEGFKNSDGSYDFHVQRNPNVHITVNPHNNYIISIHVETKFENYGRCNDAKAGAKKLIEDMYNITEYIDDIYKSGHRWIHVQCLKLTNDDSSYDLGLIATDKMQKSILTIYENLPELSETARKLNKALDSQNSFN